jgi:rSAM/selenodomain-associated transferase 2
VVVVARNEAERLPALLADLAAGSALVREVLVVDGGSDDRTALVARLAGARLIHGHRGRGQQLAAGMAASDGPWLLLLHGDVRLPPLWQRMVAAAIASPDGNRPGPGQSAWYFDLAIEGDDLALRLVEAAVALRSRWGQRPYGDQGLLLPRDLVGRSGGIAPLPLMEDLEFVLRLRRLATLRALPGALRVNGARWRQLGVWQTTWSNARLRRQWRRGMAAELLAQRYGAYQKAQRRCRGSSSQPCCS